jgi:hypothetical protein
LDDTVPNFHAAHGGPLPQFMDRATVCTMQMFDSSLMLTVGSIALVDPAAFSGGGDVVR